MTLVLMRLEHFLGKIESNELEKILDELKKRTQDGFNEFWISDDVDYPCICVSYNSDFAHVHFFEEEGDCGKQLVSKDNNEGTTEFYTNAPNESFYIDNMYVVNAKGANELVIDFCEGKNIVEKYEFEEL